MLIPDDLYSQILPVMPIPCVDLLVMDDAGSVLLLLRNNEPAAGQWFFPGGRVHFGEKRLDAAKRKLEAECGLTSSRFREIGTYDWFFSSGANGGAHSITTLFEVHVGSNRDFRLDHQSCEASWRAPHEWLELELHPFVRNGLSASIPDGGPRPTN